MRQSLGATCLKLIITVLANCALVDSVQGDRVVFGNSDTVIGVSQRFTEIGCITPNGGTGECISILLCPKLVALISKPAKHLFLAQSRCGWDRNLPRVCCEQSIANTGLNCPSSGSTRSCTSNQDDGCCTTEQTYNTDKASSTATSSTSISSTTTTTTTTTSTSTSTAIPDANNGKCDMSSSPPDRSTGCCGRSRIYQEVVTDETVSIGRYPWTAIIEYSGPKDAIQELCGGALISGRYVLTGAHCLTVYDWTPVNIRLGDYDIGHPGVDCLQKAVGAPDCTLGNVTIPIEKTIQHPDYKVGSRSQNYDIALIKMASLAPYTDFIRPICLPSLEHDVTMLADAYTHLAVVGWGLIHDSEYRSRYQRQILMSYWPTEICFPPYWRMAIRLNDGQICAKSIEERDSCRGDSGGPLIYTKNQVAEVMGIACFSSCGHTLRAPVYTKVHYYLPWITSIIN